MRYISLVLSLVFALAAIELIPRYVRKRIGVRKEYTALFLLPFFMTGIYISFRLIQTGAFPSLAHSLQYFLFFAIAAIAISLLIFKFPGKKAHP